jgi:hypothetical protein
MKMTRRKAILLLAVGISLLFSTPALAQDTGIGSGETAATNPKNREASITATVPDTQAPGAPILIAPENNSNHRSSPAFSWFLSSDNVGVTKYQLTLDGTTLFSNIPVVTSETAEFTLTYSGTTQSYQLVPKSGLATGTHTWKITALDARGNATSSTTWTFYLDTLAPTFIITTVDTTTAAISAQDIDTIPTEAIKLTHNEPTLSGTGEGGSSVILTVTWGEHTVEVLFTISSDGTWETQLPLLPRDTTVFLSFLITDAVGNISILEKVPVLLPSQVVGIPGTPGLELPIPGNPRELLLNLGENLSQNFPLSLLDRFPTPEPIATIVKHTKNVTQPIATLLFVAAAPVIAVVTLVAPFGAGISASLVQHALYALGYLPTRRKQGIVFASADQEPIPLATLVLTGKTKEGKHIQTSVFSSTDGFYPPFNPGYGRYNITVTHKHFTFPTLEKRPPHLSVENLYQGEEFVIDQYHPEPSFCIPLERVSDEKILERDKLKLLVAKLSQYRESFGVFSWIFMASITALQPSYVNALTFGSFTAVLALRALIIKKKRGGFVTDPAGTPIRNVIVKSIEKSTGTTQDITQSKQGGVFSLRGLRSDQELTVIDIGRKWPTEEATSINAQLAKSSATQSYHIILQPVVLPV